MKIRISLPEDRDYAGWLEVVDENGAIILGPLRAAGRAHEEPASAHDNASRNPLQPFGDTPLGTYVVGGVIETGPETRLHEGATLGAGGVVLLEPVSGPAALADAHGRFRLFIQGGAGDERLYATAGAVRLFDRDQAQLVALMRRAERRARCEIVTTQTLGEKIDVTRAPDDFDPPALPGRSRLSMTPVPMRPAAKLNARAPLSAAASRAARPAKRFFVAPERAGSGSTSYGGESPGPAAPGGDDGSIGVGPLPASGVDAAPTPGADLNPPQDQTVTLAETGASPLLSLSTPTPTSLADAPPGWLSEPPLGSPYSPAIGNLSDPLAPYVGANVNRYSNSSSDIGNENSFTTGNSVYPYFGPQGTSGQGAFGQGSFGSDPFGTAGPGRLIDNPLLLASADGGPIYGPDPNARQLPTPPSQQWIDPVNLQGATPVNTAPVKGFAQYQVSLNNVAYNAYVNDMAYPGQAFLVPFSQADPTADPGDFGSVLLPPGNPAAAGKSIGPATPGSPVQNRTPSAGRPPVGAGPLANALTQQSPLPPFASAVPGGLGVGSLFAPQPPPLMPPLPMPWGVAAEGPVARLFFPDLLTLPPNFSAYDLGPRDNYTETLTYERGSARQPILVVNQNFQGGDWVSIKTTTSTGMKTELNRALVSIATKDTVFRDTNPVAPNLSDVFLRVLPPDGSGNQTIFILIPETEAGNVPALQADANAHLEYVKQYGGEFGGVGYWPEDLPPNLNVRVTAWPGTELANPNRLPTWFVGGSEMVRAVGEGLTVVGGTISVGRIMTAPPDQFGSVVAQEAGGWAFSFPVAEAGAEAGAAAGVTIGAAFGIETGPGAIITGAIGGFIGGLIGGGIGFFTGKVIGGEAYSKLQSATNGLIGGMVEGQIQQDADAARRGSSNGELPPSYLNNGPTGDPFNDAF